MEGGRREISKETVRREVMGSLETAKIGGCVNNEGGGAPPWWTPSLPRPLPFKRFMLHLLTLP